MDTSLKTAISVLLDASNAAKRIGCLRSQAASALGAAMLLVSLSACGQNKEETSWFLEDGKVYPCEDMTVSDCGYNFQHCRDGKEYLCVPIIYGPSPTPTVTAIPIRSN